MRQSKLITAVLATLSFANFAHADEPKVLHEELKEAKAPYMEEKQAGSDWAATGNIGVVSDYYFRGISQSWHKPTVQGGMDITHSSGFYTGVWGSGVTPNTYPDANTEIDVYAGFNGTIPTVEKLGYTVGVYGYLYPGGSWKKYKFTGDNNPDGTLKSQTPKGGRWDTYELNAGLSYDWISAKLSYTLTDWFGADKDTGWNGSTKGSTYIELNAAYPLPWWDLTLIAHVGRLNVAGKLDPNADFSAIGGGSAPSSSTSGATNPDYTDWKIGLSKAFKIGATEGWNAGVYWIESDNSRYWGRNGYGGSSFNGAPSTQFKNLNDGRVVLTLGRTF
ncbi:TorF family putative porin [Methylophilus sp. 3sh_L]|uniref:TorF family putative porin n=1 Tax=Methylophilus sp. 3sh_L TaxID=3377114 RepID=UPI00398F7131